MQPLSAGEPIFTLPPVIVHQVMLSVDPLDLPWHIADFQIDKELWGIKGDEIIGLIDTGSSQTHIASGELVGQVIDAADFTNSRYGPYDAQGHGSHTAGIMVAKNFGIAKNCAKLVSAKGLGDNGSGSDAQIVRAMKWCVDKGATLLNMSLGSPDPSPNINGFLREISQQGVLAICAAGNSGGPVEQPAAQPFVDAVTSINRMMQLSSFSSRGEEADCCAPGEEIRSLNRGGSYAVLSGTSMAAPWICAILAVKRAMDKLAGKPPIKNAFESIEWLSRSSKDLGKPGRDWDYGVGVPDPSKIVTAQPPQQPAPGVTIGAPISLTMVQPNGETWKVREWEKVQ